MAWREDVICRERGIDIECYYASCEGLGKRILNETDNEYYCV